MSISDQIVVMKEGVVQQTGKPQEVYDNPCNLFVATFLGTPPINLFDGRVEKETLYIGSEALLPVPGIADQAVTVGMKNIFSNNVYREATSSTRSTLPSSHTSSWSDRKIYSPRQAITALLKLFCTPGLVFSTTRTRESAAA